MAAVALRFEKKIFPGLRLVNKMTKSDFGKSNGGKITRWPIKYPHNKKNAQQFVMALYPDL